MSDIIYEHKKGNDARLFWMGLGPNQFFRFKVDHDTFCIRLDKGYADLLDGEYYDECSMTNGGVSVTKLFCTVTATDKVA